IRGFAGSGEIPEPSGSELHAPIESPVGSIRIFPMNAFIAIVLASLLSRLGYQMARSPVLPVFAAHLGALPELIGVIVAASTIAGIFFKLPSGALSDVLGASGLWFWALSSSPCRDSSIRSLQTLAAARPPFRS